MFRVFYTPAPQPASAASCVSIYWSADNLRKLPEPTVGIKQTLHELPQQSTRSGG